MVTHRDFWGSGKGHHPNASIQIPCPYVSKKLYHLLHFATPLFSQDFELPQDIGQFKPQQKALTNASSSFERIFSTNSSQQPLVLLSVRY